MYAINWLNVGAIFYYMAPDFNVGVVGLGTLTSAFYLGIGIMQVPGGILAAKWGPKKTVVLGTLVSSVAAIGTSISPLIAEVTVLRFVVGSGMAFVFAPAVVLIAKFFRRGLTGSSVGLLNSAFDVGGLFGLYAWVVIAADFGWRPSLALSGGLGVITGLLAIAYVPNDESSLEFRIKITQLSKIIGDSQLILLGLGTLGLTVGNILISSFMVYYLVQVLALSPSLAGAIASAVVALPILTALIGGNMYDRIRKPKLLMLISNVTMAVALLMSGVPNLFGALSGTVLGGVAFGIGLTVTFAAAKDLKGGRNSTRVWP